MKKGLSLIEVMIAVAILSVAAAFFVPRFLKHQLQKKQTECHQNLRSLLSAEREYFKKTNLFSTDLNALQWKPEGKGWHTYRFLPTPPPKNGFLFECAGDIDKDPTIDRATIDETGQITQLSDDIRK